MLVIVVIGLLVAQNLILALGAVFASPLGNRPHVSII